MDHSSKSSSTRTFRSLDNVDRVVLRDQEDQVVHLVQLGLLALAEGLECLDGPARLVLRDALDLPDPSVLRALACEDHVASKVSLARAGLLDPEQLERHRLVSQSRPSTFGGSTARRRP